ncbi:MAG: RsmE family RNA methyltransferase [Minisyncoccia bacterium]
MRLHRFIYDFDLTKDKVLITDKSIIFQIQKVLRLKTGKEIILVNNFGQEAQIKILNFDNGMILGKILNIYELNRESQKEVNLYVSILKKENFELVCQKATELGIKNIIPLISKYTVKLNFNRERLERIIKEAAEQSGRTSIPHLLNIQKFNDIILNLKNNNFKQLNLFFDPNGKNFKEVLKLISANEKINIFIGPEGGWSEEELNLAKENNFEIVKLSDLIFRAETAAQIGSYLAIYF